MSKKLLFMFLVLCFLFSTTANAQTVKEWTVMLLINGDNNLSSYGIRDVNEMEQVGSTDNVNIIVELDTYGNYGTKRYYIEKDNNTSQITSPVIMDMAEQDTGDWQHVMDFFKWGADNYPAKKYLIAIWNHGAGWEDKNIDCFLTKGISHDDTSHNSIKTAELSLIAKGFSEHIGRKVDIYGYDACLMQMIEVAYEARNYAKYQVGAQETEPAQGWPYFKFLADLVSNPYMNGRKLSEEMVKNYGLAYSGGEYGQKSTNQSSVDIEKIDLITEKVKNFSRVLIEYMGSYKANYESAMGETQKFYYSQYKDLGHFCKKIIEKVDNSNVKRAAQEVLNALDQFVVKSVYTSTDMKNSTGVSIYLPNKYQFDYKKDSYSALKFAKDSEWDKFLSSFYYPNYPVLTISEAIFKDADGDGKVSPNEKVNFELRIKNEGNVSSSSTKVSLEYNGWDASLGNSSVYISGVGALSEEKVEGLYATISNSCAENKELSFTLRVESGNINTSKTVKLVVRRPFEVRNDILLLTKDIMAKEYKHFMTALNDAGLKYDVWDNKTESGKIPYTLLKKYVNGIVIIPAPGTGDTDIVGIKDVENYLLAGGNLFMSGQDFGYQLKGDAFLRNYICVEYVQDNTGIHSLKGFNGFGHNIVIKGGDGADNQKWPDEIQALSPAVPILLYEGSALLNRDNKDNRSISKNGHGAIFVKKDNFKVVFFGFGFEAINSASVRKEVMNSVVNMLKTGFRERVQNMAAIANEFKSVNNENASEKLIIQNRAEEALFEMMKNDSSLVLNGDREIFGNVMDMITEYRANQ